MVMAMVVKVTVSDGGGAGGWLFACAWPTLGTWNLAARG